MLIMGVDPGINASAALLRHGSGGEMDDAGDTEFIDMVDLGTESDGENRQIDVGELGELLERWDPDVAVVENVQPMPSIPDKATGVRRSMGAASAFRFGLACGMIRATIRAYQIETVMVHPRTWTKHFKLSGGGKTPTQFKAAQSEFLLQLQPSAKRFITLVKHHNRANAGLVGLWYAEKRGIL